MSVNDHVRDINMLLGIWIRQEQAGTISAAEHVHNLETLSRYVEMELRVKQAQRYIAKPAPVAYVTTDWNRQS